MSNGNAVLLAIITVCVAVTPVGSAWAPGKNKVTTHFDADALPNLLSSSKRSYVLRKARKLGLPVMAILTRAGCGACQNLKQSVNLGKELRARLAEGNILVVVAEGPAAAEWKLPGHGYVPQTLFYAPGEEARPLPIHGSKDAQPHYLHDEATLLWGVNTAIGAVASGARGADDPLSTTEL